MKTAILALSAILLADLNPLVAWDDDDDGHPAVTISEVQVLQPAGAFGGGVLTPGEQFPPGPGSMSILKRTKNCLEYTTHTSGLPPGAYTNWWVLYNAPENCTSPDCVDLVAFSDLLNPATEAAVFWATGGVVEGDGVGDFHAEVCVGDDVGFRGPLSRCLPGAVCELPALIGPQHPLGTTLTNPKGAAVHLIIKYHGPASADPIALYDQTHTLLGSCFEGANAEDLGPPFGVQCFDPQITLFDPPERGGRNEEDDD